MRAAILRMVAGTVLILWVFAAAGVQHATKSHTLHLHGMHMVCPAGTDEEAACTWQAS